MAQQAFDALKKRMTKAPVLRLPNFEEQFELECDVSGTGIGAILMQNSQPIAYFSKALGGKNLSKSAYEKELMAVVLAIQHWRTHLLGRKFAVFSDQRSLKQLLSQRVLTGNQQNWLAKLMGYNFEIIYKPRNENKGADALSRSLEDAELTNMIYYPKWLDWQQLTHEVQQDTHWKNVISDLQ